MGLWTCKLEHHGWTRLLARAPWRHMNVASGSLTSADLVLKLQGLIFATIFPFGYFLKFGVAWHDAGQPFNLTDVKFHPVRVAASDHHPPACQQDVASVHSTGT